MDESSLRWELEKLLQNDFTFERDVPGRFLVDNSRVVVDFLIQPKLHLVDRGFIDASIGVEVKAPGQNAKKGLQVAWQAITYSQSEFGGIRPAFVVIYPDLTHFFGGHSKAYYVKCLLQKANVGSIEAKSVKGDWKIVFGATSYFHSKRGLSATPNAALNRNVGSWR